MIDIILILVVYYFVYKLKQVQMALDRKTLTANEIVRQLKRLYKQFVCSFVSFVILIGLYSVFYILTVVLD